MVGPRVHGPPVSGSTALVSVVGPFIPHVGRIVTVELSGVWTGTVKVLRSIDGGATKLPLKVGGSAWGEFTANGVEQVWEEWDPLAEFYLDLGLTSGTVTYRIHN